MKLRTEPYSDQLTRWPRAGRHILAQCTDEAVVVYQAYRSAIGQFAVQHQHFGGEFSLSRMSWIKPNFLWMMYRSGWGTKDGQERTLAIWLRRAAFDAILQQAVPSSFAPAIYPDTAAWQRAVAGSEVRLQWDPDHTPDGGRVERRALQIGLRGSVLARYARQWILEIEDLSTYVADLRPLVERGEYAHLLTPREDVYPVLDTATAARLELSQAAAPYLD